MAYHEISVRKLKKDKKILAVARLTTVVAGIGIVWYFWPEGSIVSSVAIIISIIFIVLVFRDADKTEAIKNHVRLIAVNKHETDVLQHDLKGYDDGQSFADATHAYSADLDLFGPSSLYQYLSRCHADQSKKRLADYLKTPIDVSTLKEKQAAVKELSEKQSYCQGLQAKALAQPVTDQTEKRLKAFLTSPSVGFENIFWRWFQNIYPIIPISAVTLYLLDDITVKVFLTCMTVFYIITVLISRKIGPALEMLLNIEPEMDTMQKQFFLIENENFKSDFLTSLQNRLRPAGYSSTSRSIADLNTILKKNDWRSNVFINLIVQIFFVWDLRLVILLNEWKKKNRQYFNDWFTIIAEMEVMISLASLAYNEPDWCFPGADEKYFHFAAEGLGHPLIPAASRITNDFALEGTGKIALVTGSNMAGKSTFLRSVGINTVLAMTGAPVCAGKMSLSALKLISSMRVSDNLAENTSTFYAELKKIQYIIDSVNRKEKVFILLDEVLRGTNSTDRHKGAKALVRQLLQSGAVTIMATHDTELAHSEADDPSVFNYHFEGKIRNEELYFDFKLKRGISESLNATALMKKIGIHFQD